MVISYFLVLSFYVFIFQFKYFKLQTPLTFLPDSLPPSMRYPSPPFRPSQQYNHVIPLFLTFF